jgi:putative redox protein
MSSIRKAAIEWTGSGLMFTGKGTAPPSFSISIDGDSDAGPSPMQLLLLACASCSGSDVVHILEKMRVSFDRLRVEATGDRAPEEPSYFRTIHLAFVVRGPEVPLEKVQRAVDLSLEKYCSVVHSLKETIDVTSTVAIG